MYDELTAEREKSISINMPGLMKDVYAWMAIALVVTGFHDKVCVYRIS